MTQSIFPAMKISAAGMEAQRRRMDVVAENIANAESTNSSNGLPYRKRQVVFRAVESKQPFHAHMQHALGHRDVAKSVEVARVVEDHGPFREVYNPGHPDADASGMVQMPNVNPIEEMVDMTSAVRSFEANATAMEAYKRMLQKTLELMR